MRLISYGMGYDFYGHTGVQNAEENGTASRRERTLIELGGVTSMDIPGYKSWGLEPGWGAWKPVLSGGLRAGRPNLFEPYLGFVVVHANCVNPSFGKVAR
jgi:hypothetical protein